MDWLLEEYDSLYYLKNGTDTVVANVISGFGQSEYEWEFGIRTGDNNHYGYSRIKFFVSNDSIPFRTWINACNKRFHIMILNYIQAQRLDFYASKDSITNINQTINGKVYNNCFHFSNPKDTI
jgi:hypothetical protein